MLDWLWFSILRSAATRVGCNPASDRSRILWNPVYQLQKKSSGLPFPRSSCAFFLTGTEILVAAMTASLGILSEAATPSRTWQPPWFKKSREVGTSKR
jgi:hypothetical protein